MWTAVPYVLYVLHDLTSVGDRFKPIGFSWVNHSIKYGSGPPFSSCRLAAPSPSTLTLPRAFCNDNAYVLGTGSHGRGISISQGVGRGG